ncbi:MAG: hypothetical protein HUU20_17620 [Pirellulales bacterium]|nr:hypothetical protein [Pirellulales bacterium]
MFFKRLWRDESGIINTTDVVLLTTILGLGIIVGVVMLRNQVVQEFGDLSTAIGNLSQSYEYQERTLTSASGTQTVAGSDYEDELDPGDGDDPPGEPPAGISITSPGPTLPNTTPGED